MLHVFYEKNPETLQNFIFYDRFVIHHLELITFLTQTVVFYQIYIQWTHLLTKENDANARIVLSAFHSTQKHNYIRNKI